MPFASVSDERVSGGDVALIPVRFVWTFLTSTAILEKTSRYRIAESI